MESFHQMNKGRLARWLARMPGSSQWWGPPRRYGDSIEGLGNSEVSSTSELQARRIVEHQIPPLANQQALEAQPKESNSKVPVPAQRIFLLPAARVLGANFGHCLITNADRFILGCSQNWDHSATDQPVHWSPMLPRCRRIAGRSFSLISLWSDNYWHWMFDELGKLLLLRKSSAMPQVDRYLVLNLKRFRFKLALTQVSDDPSFV